MELDLQLSALSIEVIQQHITQWSFNTDNCSTTWVTTSDLASVIGDPERALCRATPDLGPQPGWYRTVLTMPAVAAKKEGVPYFMERIQRLYTSTPTRKDMTVTVIKGDSDNTSHKP